MKVRLLLVFFITFRLSFGQEVFRPGFLLTLSGDTISGNIGNLFDSKYVKFEFEGKTKVYSPGQIKGFIFKENIYASKFVEVNFYTPNLLIYNQNEIKYGPFYEKYNETKDLKDTVFLHVLITGKLNLYELKSKDNFSTFYAENQNEILELEPPRAKIISDIMLNARNINSNLSIITKYSIRLDYINSLNQLMAENPIINNKQTFCAYNVREISEFILAYNNKFNQYKSISYVKNVSRKVYFGVLAGGLYGNPETTYSAFILMPSKLFRSPK
jgi:hypothetical protein